ncbi:amino acid racemase [Geomonas sp. Red32]|uniref:aspartate/glutamate racemase family protein n=1 Tax=Geomonas sp. Red32 TaxID=2912856 RepID=UPI00202D0496|nr:amino acid racemase [Geomonas sp. Red32]MCM0081958.1 amino acid racemase [Geomonas sp. Red32]
MKKIGLIGGIGPESTLDYYRRIIDAVRGKSGGLSSPEIIIYSANLNEALSIMQANELDRLVGWLLVKIEALASTGADFAAITANTPHMVFDQVAARSPLPLISIVEATCETAKNQGLRRVGLMGTGFTMRADFFPKTFRSQGLELIVPSPEDQDIIHEKLFTEIELGIIRDETREELLTICRNMIERDGIDSLILGCTELPLILPDEAYGIPFLNTTAIHVDRIVRECLNEK